MCLGLLYAIFTEENIVCAILFVFLGKKALPKQDLLLKTHFWLHNTLMTIYWNIVIWDRESAEVIKRPLIFIQVEAAV